MNNQINAFKGDKFSLLTKVMMNDMISSINLDHHENI